MSNEPHFLLELLSCPCCGEETEYICEGHHWWAARCKNSDCGISTPLFEDPKEAAAVWNCRNWRPKE